MGNIVWLASYPKSGNTWMRAFIANLLANGTAPVPLADLPNYGRLEADPELYSRAAGRPITELDFTQLCALRTTVHLALAEAAQRTVFVKTHSMAGIFGGVPLLTPQVSAGAIYVVRNPLDVVVSMTHHFSICVDDAIDYLGDERAATGNNVLFVTEFIGSWSQHVRSWADIAGPRILVLRYEDMLQNPELAFGMVAQLIGIGADRIRIERAIQHASFASLAALEKRDGFTEAPVSGEPFFRVGRANQWRTKLNNDQIRRVIAAHRIQMARFHYMPNGF